MRNITLILLLLVFTISCQINVENSNTTSPQPTTQTDTEIQSKDLPPTSPIIASDIDSKVGTIDDMDEHFKGGEKKIICLTTQNSILKIGDKIQIVLPEIPQRVFQAEVSEKLKERCSSVNRIGNNSDISSYSVNASEKDESKIYYGIAVINSLNQVKIDKGLAHVDLDNDGKDEYFRECYGNESLHLFVWNGKPLIGKRIWYSYYAFNYDTPPSCKDKDFEGIEN